MKIVGFGAETDVSSHCRIFCWLDAMKRRGHDVWIDEDMATDLESGGIDAIVKGVDIVVAGRFNHPKGFCALEVGRALYGYKLVIDTDDLVSAVGPSHPSFGRFHPATGMARMADAQYRDADLVTVTTGYLADDCRRSQSRVVVIPNCVSPEYWGPAHFRDKETRHRDDVRIVHAGGTNHWGDLEMIKEPVSRIVREFPQVKMIFVGFLPAWAMSLPQRQIFFVPFLSYRVFPKAMRWLCADIGIAPVEPIPLNFAKSHIKYLDFSMSRICGIYSDEVTYATVREGETGLKAKGAEDWYEKLSEAICDAGLRQRIARAAEDHVLSEWTVSNYADKYEAAMNLVLSERAAPVVTALEEGDPVACQPSL